MGMNLREQLAALGLVSEVEAKRAEDAARMRREANLVSDLMKLSPSAWRQIAGDDDNVKRVFYRKGREIVVEERPRKEKVA